MADTITQGDFPYTEIRRANGDMFTSWQEAREAGYLDQQIWSVTEHEGTWCYGPPHHYVNLLGFIATKEWHDNATYYEEVLYDRDGDLIQ